jgi:hypothetical protein
MHKQAHAREDPGLPVGQKERRGAQRHKLHLDVEIWPREKERDGVRSEHFNTENVSVLGFLFIGESRWRLGSKFNFWITMPAVFSETLSGLMSGQAQVVRCESMHGGERHRVAMRINRNVAGKRP